MRVIDGRGNETADHAMHAYYPHLLARVASLVPESWVAPSEPRTLDDHLRAAAAIRIRARIAVALLSLLAVPLTWWLARRFLPDPWPLLAAALAAASPFVVWFAQQARPHAAAASFALLAVCAAVHLRRHGGWRAVVVAGLAAGLAVGSLQNGIAALGPIGLALILRWRADRARVLASALAILAIMAVFVVWLYPFLFAGAEHDGVGVDGAGVLALSRHKVFLELFNGRGFAVVWRSLVDYDPVLTGCAILGLAAAACAPFVLRGAPLGLRGAPLALRRAPLALRGAFGRERAFDLAVVLAYALPYFVVIGLYQRTYQRFALPLVPFLALLGAFGLFAAARTGGRIARPLGTVLGGFAALVGAVQFAWCWQLGTARSRTDTVQEAAAWIAAHARPDTDLIDVMPGLDLPLKRTEPSLQHGDFMREEQSLPWYRHLYRTPVASIEADAYDLRWMDLFSQEARFAARADARPFVSALTGRYAVIVSWPRGFRPAFFAVRQALTERGRCVARFSPDDPDVGDELPLAHQDDELPFTDPWAWRILRARCVGPSVEIYELR
jgi:hypothetical protein